MKIAPKNVGIALAWFYASLVVLWLVLHVWLGDTVWCLALLSAFAPCFFLPLTLILPTCFIYRRRSFWTSAISPALIFLLLYGHLFLPAWPTASVTDEAPLTVMSFNIWGGSQSKEAARVILANGTPDIVALQELRPQMAELLIEEVGDFYPHRVLDIGIPDNALGVLSRYPLTELDSRHLSGSGSQIQVLQVEVNHQTLTLYNCRIQGSNILVYFERGVSIADEVKANLQARGTLVQQLIADIATRPGPVIVAGDLNSTDQSDVYAILTRDLTDAHQAVGWGFGHTFPAYAGSFRGIPIIPRQMRLDMIFYSEGFVALNSCVSSIHGESDHLPVLAQLAWRKQ